MQYRLVTGWDRQSFERHCTAALKEGFEVAAPVTVVPDGNSIKDTSHYYQPMVKRNSPVKRREVLNRIQRRSDNVARQLGVDGK